jgi:hypothetical protein
MNLIESIKSGQGVEALNAIKSSLNQKTLAAVEEARHEIAESVYGVVEDFNDDVPMHPLGSVLSKHGFTQHHPDAADLSYSKKDDFYKKGKHLVAVSKKGRNWAHYPGDGSGMKQGTGSLALDKHVKSLKEEVNLQEGSGGAIPWPAQSKHLKDYKKNEAGEYVHPEGHKITVNKEKGEITHTAKDGKPRTFKHLGDLHPHLSKLHHGFDAKVKEHMANHQGGGIEQNRLHHKMGALSYKFHKTGYDDANHEEDATNYKAMHKALMNLSKSDRGVK